MLINRSSLLRRTFVIAGQPYIVDLDAQVQPKIRSPVAKENPQNDPKNDSRSNSEYLETTDYIVSRLFHLTNMGLFSQSRNVHGAARIPDPQARMRL